MKNVLDVFEAEDAVELCRKCDTRTDIESADDGWEIHVCPACTYRYELMVPEDDYEDDEENETRTPPMKSKVWK